MQKQTISLQDFKKLENKTELNFPITIGVLRSKNRINFWQSKAFNYSFSYVHTIGNLFQFFLWYFLIDKKAISLIFLGSAIVYFFISKRELEKSNAIFEPNRFYKQEIDYCYDDILIIHSDKIELLSYFNENQGEVFFKDIDSVAINSMRGQQGIDYQYTKEKFKSLKSTNKKMGWFRSVYLKILNEKLVINSQYLTNLSEVGNLIIHSYLQKPPIYLTYHKGFPQEGFKINSNQ